MSDSELTHNEDAKSNEDAALFVKQEKTKHPSSYTEKDDAKLLSDGTSEDGDEDDLVLEYSDSTRISGNLEDGDDFEKGDSTSASDNEIVGRANENFEYRDTSSKLAKLVSFENEEVLHDEEEKADAAKQKVDCVAKDKDILRIAETLSHQMDPELESTHSKIVPPPGRPYHAVVHSSAVEEEKQQTDQRESRLKTKQMESPASSFSDSGRFSANKKEELTSSNHSSDGELEWDEAYGFSTKPGSKSKARLRESNIEEIASAVEGVSIKDDREEVENIDRMRIEKTVLDNKELNETNAANTLHEAKVASAKKLHSRDASEGKKEDEYSKNSKKPSNRSKMTAKETAKKGTGGKSRRSGRRTRYKVYLDDPDIHQTIADFSGLLRKLKEEVEKGELKPRPGNRLHPQSRDDVFEGSQKRRGGKNYTGSKSVDQPRGSKVFQPIQQSVSDGYLGPYDGHGKRGRNLIARIKGLSESSSSPGEEDDDDDEVTNTGIFKSKAKTKYTAADNRKENKQYDLCSECGQLHSADEDSNDESEQEICPDCGVPHNPFKHPPSPSSKAKWRLYVEHCRKAMIQLSNQTYHQLPQDPPEPARDETLPSIEGPHTTEELKVGARYRMKYLGTTQVTTQHPVTKETRMEQAQQAYARIKAPDDEVQPATDVDMIISLERIKVVNFEDKHEDIMMDHALRTVCFICDMKDILVLMSRRLTTDMPEVNLDQDTSKSLSDLLTDREKRTSRNICHIYQSDESQTISKAIGQAFNMAYRQFLKSNGISHDTVEEAEYCHVLESQKIVGQDLDLLADSNNTRDIVLQKKRGESLGIMLLESGWGSMLPTVFVAHIANYSPAARLGGQLSVGDHILACNSSSLVGLPLSECNQTLRNTRSSARVILRIVSCPPVVDVVVSRPDVKYQLGFSVQNGTICSLLRGGIAERGGVRVGHRIIEINGESVVAKSHQHIVDILANTSGEIGMKTLPVAMYRLMVGIDTPTHV